MRSDGAGGVRSARPWWRERWMAMAIGFTVAQIAGFWWLSPASPAPTAPRLKHPFVVAPPGLEARAGQGTDLALLLSPALFLIPLSQGFSGSGWLGAEGGDVSIETRAAEVRPLPFVAIPSAGDESGFLSGDAGLTAHGLGGDVRSSLPTVRPMPMPVSAQLTLTIVDGLTGWELVPRSFELAVSSGVAVGRAVLRVTIASTGEVATPPTVWESSGDTAVDEAALALAGGLRFRRRVEVADVGPDDLGWGLVAVEWPPGGAP